MTLPSSIPSLLGLYQDVSIVMPRLPGYTEPASGPRKTYVLQEFPGYARLISDPSGSKDLRLRPNPSTSDTTSRTNERHAHNSPGSHKVNQASTARSDQEISPPVDTDRHVPVASRIWRFVTRAFRRREEDNIPNEQQPRKREASNLAQAAKVTRLSLSRAET